MKKKEEASVMDPQLAHAQKEVEKVEKAYERDVRITQAQPIIKRIALIVWLAFDVFLLALFLYIVGGYLLLGQFQDRQAVAELFQETDTIHQESLERSASALLIGDVERFDYGEAADFYAEIENVNEDWYASFLYGFEDGEGRRTEMQRGFIYPQEERPLILLGSVIGADFSSAELVVEEVQWRRLDAREVEDGDVWLEERQDFSLLRSEYGERIEFEEGEVVRSVFAIENATPYSYWSAPFWVILERGGAVVAVNQVSIAGFETGETREVTVNWFESAPSRADSIRIYPVIDYLDDDLYMRE